jgi:Fur family ferric uptake transcriptional regulator
LTADAGAAEGGEHHHHLICRSCGRTAEVAGSALERWLAAGGGQPGVAPLTAEVFGTCPDCAASAEHGRRSARGVLLAGC